jgi:hypothetical protein
MHATLVYTPQRFLIFFYQECIFLCILQELKISFLSIYCYLLKKRETKIDKQIKQHQNVAIRIK